eukprot:sb/3470564/
MQRALFLLLAACLLCGVHCLPAKGNKRGQASQRAVEATVNGRTITTQDDFERAMGNFGRNIYKDGFSDSVQGEEDIPSNFRFKAKQLKNFKHQDSSVLGMMKKYGYLEVALGMPEEEIDESDNIVDERTLKKALRKFQKRYKLEVTGELTDETKQLLTTSRCGVKDVEYGKSVRITTFDLNTCYYCYYIYFKLFNTTLNKLI